MWNFFAKPTLIDEKNLLIGEYSPLEWMLELIWKMIFLALNIHFIMVIFWVLPFVWKGEKWFRHQSFYTRGVITSSLFHLAFYFHLLGGFLIMWHNEQSKSPNRFLFLIPWLGGKICFFLYFCGDLLFFLYVCVSFRYIYIYVLKVRNCISCIRVPCGKINLLSPLFHFSIYRVCFLSWKLCFFYIVISFLVCMFFVFSSKHMSCIHGNH